MLGQDNLDKSIECCTEYCSPTSTVANNTKWPYIHLGGSNCVWGGAWAPKPRPGYVPACKNKTGTFYNFSVTRIVRWFVPKIYEKLSKLVKVRLYGQNIICPFFPDTVYICLFVYVQLRNFPPPKITTSWPRLAVSFSNFWFTVSWRELVNTILRTQWNASWEPRLARQHDQHSTDIAVVETRKSNKSNLWRSCREIRDDDVIAVVSMFGRADQRRLCPAYCASRSSWTVTC